LQHEEPYPSKLKNKRICPKCGKRGFLVVRWVRASYYPRYSSIDILEVEQKREELAKDPENKEIQSWLNQFGNGFSGNRYWGHVRPTPLGLSEMRKQNFYRVITRKYYCYYFGHYDAEKQRQQMINYRSGKRRSRPNGRKWCKVSVGISDRRNPFFS
jgi:hypothetical protein